MDFALPNLLVNRLVVMDFGAKFAEGLPQTIQDDPVVVEAYLGVPKAQESVS